MYSVSDKYIAAMRANTITDRVYGRIFLKNGTAIDVTDDIIVQGKLNISRKVCGNTLKIGTFYVSTMSLSLFDDAAYNNEYGGAKVVLKYSVLIDKANDVWEDVPLGPFFVDGKESKRRSGQITLTAYDNASKFDIALPDLSTVTTLWGALQAAYYKANVGIAMSEDDFNALPNANIIPDFTSAKIQSCRDLVMWIAQAVGGYAYINNQGLLVIKRYTYDGADNYDRLITAQERTSVEYTDTRTYLAYLSAYCAGEPKNYTKVSEWTGTDAPHIKEGALSLSNNPLFAALSATAQDAANEAIISARPYPTRYIKAQGFIDPAIEPLDTLAFNGGSIDIGQLISACTEVKWVFRGTGTIICNNFEEYSEDASESAISLAAETDGASAVEDDVKVPMKPQLEKRVDDLERHSGTAKKLQTSANGAYAETTGTGDIRIVNASMQDYVTLGTNDAHDVVMTYNGGQKVVIGGREGTLISVNDTAVDIYANFQAIRLKLDAEGISLTNGSESIALTESSLSVRSSDMSDPFLHIDKSSGEIRLDAGDNRILLNGDGLLVNAPSAEFRIDPANDMFQVVSGTTHFEVNPSGAYINGTII